MHDDHKEDGELPNFSCRLHIPDEVPVGIRTIIEQQDIGRQIQELLYRRATRANTLAEHSVKRIEALERSKYLAVGALIGIQTVLHFLIK